MLVSRLTSSHEYIFGVLTCTCVSIGFMFFCESCVHWFIIPITLCAILLVKDIQDWFTGKLDVFDPVCFVALLGSYFFFLAPLLHVYWDSWVNYVTPPNDWRTWLGYMGILNFIGLAIYKAIIGNKRWVDQKPLRLRWSLNERCFKIVCGLALMVSMSVQVYVYQSVGGILGYIHAYEDRSGAFEGMGWLFMISESFPILSFMVYAVAARRHEALRQWGIIILAILLFVGLKLLFGGMRGSRSNTVWGLFWMVGIIHYWIRPINKKSIISGLVAFVIFMYSFGVYKSHGLAGFDGLMNPLQRIEMAEEAGRTLDRTLLGDLGRSDVQAYLLYSITDPNNQYNYKWGQTYLSSLMLLIPKQIRPTSIGKGKAGTEAQYSYYSDTFLSSRVYGLAGESMLNWGIISLPFAFAMFGLIVAKARRFIQSVSAHDVRILLIPFIINFVIIVLTGDSDNVVFFSIKNGALPFLVLWLSARKIPVTEIENLETHRA